MKTLIFGAGNLLLSDEGFGVHFIEYLENNFQFPESVELYDGGTLGILASYKLEEADRVYIVDVIVSSGKPGDVYRYNKDDFMLNRIPVKLSPHQLGIQEVLFISELRDRCPREITLLGIVPESLATGSTLSPLLQKRLSDVADVIIDELRAQGTPVLAKAA